MKITHPDVAVVYLVPDSRSGGVEIRQSHSRLYLPPTVARVLVDTVNDYLEGEPIPRSEVDA